jgi:hypothetical protein
MKKFILSTLLGSLTYAQESFLSERQLSSAQ